jgi:hypothetical protein
MRGRRRGDWIDSRSESVFVEIKSVAQASVALVVYRSGGVVVAFQFEFPERAAVPLPERNKPREPLASINGSWSSREHILFVTQDSESRLR